MRKFKNLVAADELLIESALVAQRAAKACRNWEQGGPSGPVGDAAEVALLVADRALAAAEDEDDVVLSNRDPEKRRARLLLAGYLLLLAGTDEHGESCELSAAASIFRRAAVA